jgi:hypothetical protein
LPLALAIAFFVASGASAQVKDEQQPAAAAPSVVSPPKDTVPAETADCARMPTETQKSDCLRQHPFTGRTLLPDEKGKTEMPAPDSKGQ